MPDHLKTLLVVGYHCGKRLGELRKLVWSQVDLRAQEIRIEMHQAKGKKPRTLPIYGDMVDWLEWQAEQRVGGCNFVFHYRGRPIGWHLKGWTRACKVAGLPASSAAVPRTLSGPNLSIADFPLMWFPCTAFDRD